MNPISQTFARYAITASDFPEAARSAAKTFMLDSLGVGIAGFRAPFNDSVFKTAMSWGQGRYDEAAAIFILLFVTIVIVDQLSGLLRDRLTHGSEKGATA